MRWKMCPKCNVKLSHEAGDKYEYKCNVCGQEFTLVKGQLERYVKRKQVKINFAADLNEVLDKLEEKVRDL